MVTVSMTLEINEVSILGKQLDGKDGSSSMERDWTFATLQDEEH